MYSDKFLKLEEEFKKAELNFNKNKNATTAKKLSDIRSCIQNLRKEEKYTEEYLKNENERFIRVISGIISDTYEMKTVYGEN